MVHSDSRLKNLLKLFVVASLFVVGFTVPIRAQLFTRVPCLTWLLPFSGAPEEPQFGGDWSYACDITPDGRTVVGYAYYGGLESSFYAAIWSLPPTFPCVHVSGRPVSLRPCCSDNWSQATGIAYSPSVVVGASGHTESGWLAHHAVRWLNGAVYDLGTLGGDSSWAHDVSADGSVTVGWSTTSDGHWRACVWVGGAIVELPLIGGQNSEAYAVSADGWYVCGWAETTSGKRRAVRWDRRTNTVEVLGTLGGDYSEAYGISEDGKWVVGVSETENGALHAFRWSQSTGMQDLGVLPGGTWSRAYDVSADGSTVVGDADDSLGSANAVWWTPRRGMQNLNLLLPPAERSQMHLTTARSITPNSLHIVGWGNNYLLTQGATRAIGYRLSFGISITPVPIR